jgi:hypothetical protein
MKYYQSPFTEQQWTKEQWEQYVAWEESRNAENKAQDCDDCNGCSKCKC